MRARRARATIINKDARYRPRMLRGRKLKQLLFNSSWLAQDSSQRFALPPVNPVDSNLQLCHDCASVPARWTSIRFWISPAHLIQRNIYPLQYATEFASEMQQCAQRSSANSSHAEQPARQPAQRSSASHAAAPMRWLRGLASAWPGLHSSSSLAFVLRRPPCSPLPVVCVTPYPDQPHTSTYVTCIESQSLCVIESK